MASAVDALNKNDSEKAARLLQALIEQFPNTIWAGRAELALGKHLSDKGDRQAVPYLVAATRHLPLLADYAYYYLGEASLKGADFNGAATAFDLAERYPESLLRPQALGRSAEAWYQADDCRRSRERQARFLADYGSHALLPSVLLRQADCQYKAGDMAAAVASFRRVWTQFAASPQSDDAAMRLERMKGEGVAIPELTLDERWARAKALFDAAQYPRAAKALEEYLTKLAPAPPNRDRARLNLGVSHVRLKRYDDARASFEQVVKDGANGAYQDAVVWLGRVFLRLGADEPFLSLAQREVESGRLTGEARGKFLLLLAAQHADRGRTERAVQTYQQIGAKDRTDALAAEGYYRAGWLLYKAGRFEEAVRSFDQVLSVQPGGPFTLPATYWKARSAERAGDAQKAAGLFQAVCTEAANTYYCQSARLRKGVTFANGSAESARVSQGLEVKERPVAGEVRYQRAVELRFAGLLREAGEEIAAFMGRVGSDRGEILWAAGVLKEFGEYHRALKMVQLVFADVIDRGNAGVPPAFWELAYPQGWLPAIQAMSGGSVDPYLVAAIIREESVYNPDAVSPVGAMGLMQVMPQTGQMVAAKLGGEPFNKERLFDPRYNIRLGTWYLGHLAEKFDHNPVYMIAAYNAGPEAVSKWVQQFGGGEPDEFIESIPYTETRLYVKRVLRSHREYRRITGRECAGSFFERAC